MRNKSPLRVKPSISSWLTFSFKNRVPGEIYFFRMHSISGQRGKQKCLCIGMNKDQKRDQIQCIHEFMQTAQNKLDRNRLTNFGYFALAVKSKGSK